MSRKPSLNLEKLKEIQHGPLLDLKACFEDFEEMRKLDKLRTPFIAFEALGAICGAYMEGYSFDQIRKTFPPDWKQTTVEVPLPLLLALRSAWSDYINADIGRSMEEAFQIHARGAGKSPLKKQLANLRLERRTANKVEIEYLTTDKALDVVRAEIAEEEGISIETVERRHKLHKVKIREGLKSLGILRG